MYYGGDRAWRNHNPGNLRTGKVSRRNGQIGTAGGFAVFPAYRQGRSALEDSLMNAHGNKSLAQMIRVYAPKSENKPEKYLRFLRQRTGVRDARRIKDFSKAQFRKLCQAIEDMEGQRPGEIQILPVRRKIVAVQRKRSGGIFRYLVDGLGWLSRTRVVKLTRDGEIDAVVVTDSEGTDYVRTRPDATTDNNLDDLDE